MKRKSGLNAQYELWCKCPVRNTKVIVLEKTPQKGLICKSSALYGGTLPSSELTLGHGDRFGIFEVPQEWLWNICGNKKVTFKLICLLSDERFSVENCPLWRETKTRIQEQPFKIGKTTIFQGCTVCEETGTVQTVFLFPLCVLSLEQDDKLSSGV